MRTLLYAGLLGSLLALAGATTATAHPPMGEPAITNRVTAPVVIVADANQGAEIAKQFALRCDYPVVVVSAYDELRCSEALALADSCQFDYSVAMLPLEARQLRVYYRAVQGERTLVKNPLPFMGYMKGYYGRKLHAGNFYWHVEPARLVPVYQPAPAQGIAGSIDRG